MTFTSAAKALRLAFSHALRTFGATGTVAGITVYPPAGAGQQHTQDDQADAPVVI
jgi:hypothetical protein